MNQQRERFCRMENQEYFLTSRHGNLGSTVVFHNKNEQGYGTDLSKLNTYSKEEAQKHHDNYGRSSLPILVTKAMNKCTRRVDMQYLDVAEGAPRSAVTLCAVSVAGDYDGNDIRFIKKGGGYTFNLDDAELCQLSMLKGLGDKSVIWSFQYLNTKHRLTLQVKNINTRSMCRGVKLERIKKYSDSGLNRWNCPACGKISWQYNPYDFDGCKDSNCKSHNPYMSSY